MYMRVKCIKADDTNILVEDAIYTVEDITHRGNYILLETAVPEGFNCFDKNRFEVIEVFHDETDPFEDFGFDQEEIDIVFS
jgi:hypothetical protein